MPVANDGHCQCALSRAPIRNEPPPKMKRRPWQGGASDFDPASLGMVPLCGSIIRRRKAPYKVTQALNEVHITPSTMSRAAPLRSAVAAFSGVNRSQP
jgi:hypothetical protein